MSSHTSSLQNHVEHPRPKSFHPLLQFPPAVERPWLQYPSQPFQVSSMAEIDSKEAQKKLKAGICFRITSHNKHTWFLLSQKKHKLQVQERKTSAINRVFFVDFEPDPRVPLIIGRSFLKTSRALIDVYEGEITLRVGREAITFNLDQTSRYTADYNHMTANRIDVIDMACEEYSQGYQPRVLYP
ncbi:hypothetical protein Tco_0661012 [Tanacetum coccineum]